MVWRHVAQRTNGGTLAMAIAISVYIARLISYLVYGLIFVIKFIPQSYGLILVDGFHTTKSIKFNTPRKFLRIWYHV